MARGRHHLAQFRASKAVEHFLSVIKDKALPLAQQGKAAAILALLCEDDSRVQLRKAGVAAILLRLLRSSQVIESRASVLGLLMQLLIDPETGEVSDQKKLVKLVKLAETDAALAQDISQFERVDPHIKIALEQAIA